MIVLSLDASTVSTGYALFIDGVYQFSGTLKIKHSKGDICSMYELIRDKIYGLHKQYGLDMVVVEDAYMGINKNSFKMETMLLGSVYGLCYNLMIDTSCMLAVSWRKVLKLNKKGAKRAELKQMTKEYIESLGIVCDSEDAYDAVGLGIAWIKEMN